MIGCYIIYSEKLKRFYVGALQESLESRIQRHNNHFYGTSKFTSKATDWKLFLFIECECYSQAIAIERHIKRMKSSVYIHNLEKYSQMQQKLKAKYKRTWLPR